MFDTDELNQIVLGLQERKLTLRDIVTTFEGFAREIESGKTLFPFLPGEPGARAARGVAAEHQHQIDMIEKMIKRITVTA
ncbi:hypothetical protein QTQ03_20370 [Micromonospora sp. WMMA1363]|uniref:hypothetical protein n=1 Tax=Micromonospora sp. WMMA1363 TaxID=3053985 RepID=UPI00259D2C81|nr:hypothetical protein [Micromonospora sp. WMMA1363]MDM4721834.1 hypothetical protein [Micromonospora sp. WMMA1363]